MLKGNAGGLRTATFSNDGIFVLTASDDKSARIWDALSGAELRRLNGGDGKDYGAVETARFSADGTRAVTSSEDKSVRIWDTTTGKELLNLKGHGYKVTNAEFSNDGTRIITVSNNSRVRVWDVASGELVLLLRNNDRSITSARFSDDGKQILMAAADGTARVRDATWLVNVRGDDLIRRICDERLVGASKRFTDEDAVDPIFSGLVGDDTCDRPDFTSRNYWDRVADKLWRRIKGDATKSQSETALARQ